MIKKLYIIVWEIPLAWSCTLILCLAEIWVSRCRDDFEPQVLMSSGKIACYAMAPANNW